MKIIKNKTNKNKILINGQTYFFPNEWGVKNLNDITIVKDGTHDSPKYINNGIPFITSKNLKNGKIDFKNVKYISKEDHDKFFKRSNVQLGDILFGMIGTIGEPTIVKTKKTFSIKNVALIKNNANYSQSFLRYQLYSSKLINDQLNFLKNGGVLSFIKLSDIRNLKLLNIKIEEQEKIASALSLQERQIEIIEELIEKLETRNQYYAEKLLSGEKRIRRNEQGKIEFYDNTEWQDVSLNGKVVSIPVGWEVKKIGEDGISLLSSGINPFVGKKNITQLEKLKV